MYIYSEAEKRGAEREREEIVKELDEIRGKYSHEGGEMAIKWCTLTDAIAIIKARGEKKGDR